MRNIGIIIIILLWLALGFRMCQDQQRCCGEPAATTKVVQKTTPVPIAPKASCTSGYVCFADGSCDPIFRDNFNNLRDSLLGLISSGQVLRITGHFSSKESYTGSAEDLGMCRAMAIRKRFGALLKDGQVELSSQRTVGRTLALDRRVSYSINKNEVKSVKRKTLIYFPYNSTDKLADAEIEKYLDAVAAQVKTSGERIRLTGHTDSKGRPEYNLELGRRRAIVIRNYLVSKGVPKSKIIVTSKGEAEPVASNNTKEGRAQNRRTVLEIIS